MACERRQLTEIRVAERVGVTSGFITKLEKDETLPRRAVPVLAVALDLAGGSC